MIKQTVQRFELRREPRKDGEGAVAVYQSRAVRRNGQERMVRVAGLACDGLKAVVSQVQAAVRRAGQRPQEFLASAKEPLELLEEDGVRLALLFLTVQPLRKAARVQSIAAGLQTMGSEELYYWFSKSSAKREGARARRALRMLLAEE